MNKTFAYVLTVTEHERGWGTRHDGYLLFLSKEAAETWVKEQYEERDARNVPDCYDTYDSEKWEPVHESLYNKLILEGRVWVRSLSEVVKATKTKKISLVWTLEVDDVDGKLTDDALYAKYLGDIDVNGKITIKSMTIRN